MEEAVVLKMMELIDQKKKINIHLSLLEFLCEPYFFMAWISLI